MVYRAAAYHTPLWIEPNMMDGRFSRKGEGPVQYFCLHPLGPLAEAVRRLSPGLDPAEIRRPVWALRLPDWPVETVGFDEASEMHLDPYALVCPPKGYADCQQLGDTYMEQEDPPMLKTPVRRCPVGPGGAHHLPPALLSCPAGHGRTLMYSWSIPRACLAAAALLITCATIATLAPPGAAIVPPSDCGMLTVKAKRYNIKADQLRCRTARSFASQYLSKRHRPSGYRCRDFGRETKLKFRCARGIQVFFAIRR